MQSFFKRLFRVAGSEAHSVVDKLENPIKMTEQGLRELRKDFADSMKSLAEVKASQIRQRQDLEDKKQLTSDYERKAMLLLQRGGEGSLTAAEADRLAREALVKKEQSAAAAVSIARGLERYDGMVARLEANVSKLKSQIGHWDTELTTLKARAKVAQASSKLNRQLSQVDAGGTIAMLEKMKDKVIEEEALAESYGELAGAASSVDDEINRALAAGSAGDAPQLKAAEDSLVALKAKMGLGSP